MGYRLWYARARWYSARRIRISIVSTSSEKEATHEDSLDIADPRDLTVWQWLFESKDSPLQWNLSAEKLAAYTNATTSERINWLQAKECGTYISTALVKNYGMRQGDSVVLFSQNTVWYPVTMLAAVRAGGKVCGASPAYGVEEMTHALKVSDAQFLFTVPESMKVALEAAKLARIPQSHVFLIEGKLKGFTTLQELIAVGKSFGDHGQVPASVIPKGKNNGEVCGFLCFSSGTTGLPKAVSLTPVSSLDA